VHFIIGRSGGKTPKVEPVGLEAAVRDIVRTWDDAPARGGGERRGRRRLVAIAGASPRATATILRLPRRCDARPHRRLDANNDRHRLLPP
jgi:hypothetical protein